MTSVEKVKKAFGHRLVGGMRMRNLVCEVVSIFPEDIVSEITSKCWFVSSFDDAWGFVLRGDELNGEHLIFLSDDLLLQERSQQYYTITHEIGHVILGHKNAILEKQSKAQTKRQEKQADEFARKYLELAP